MTSIKIHNTETDEIIERDMNESEISAYENYQKEVEQAISAKTAETKSKSALLEKLGITEEEAKLLLS